MAPVVYFDAKSEADFAKYKGKLKGAIVLTGPLREVAARFEPLARRMTDTELLELADADEPQRVRGRRGGQRRGPARTRGQDAARGGPAVRACRPLRSAGAAWAGSSPRDAGPDGARAQEDQVPGR